MMEMRWRVLSLAADLDRLDRQAIPATEPRRKLVEQSLALLQQPNRAARGADAFQRSDATARAWR